MKKYIRASIACLLLLLVLGALIPAAAPARADGVPPSGGTAWAWGYNNHGELGNGANTDTYSPVQVSNLSGVTAISAGRGCTLAVRSDGTAWAWGEGDYGQLGRGSWSNSNLPVRVKDATGTGYLTDITAVSVSLGGHHCLALKSDGTVWAWGDNEVGQLGTPSGGWLPGQVYDASGEGYLTNVIAIAAGDSFSLALKSDGTVWAWGNNHYGELGNGTNTKTSLPVQVKDAAGTGYLTNITAIAAGSVHSLALKSDGTVWAWGDDTTGQLGDGNSWTSSNLPILVKDESGVGHLAGIIAISAGGGHSLAVESLGTVWAWGANFDGELGNGTNVDSYLPVQVNDATGSGYLTNVASVSAGSNFSLAIKSDGTAWAWGYNNWGQLGDDTTNERHEPVFVSGISGVKAISAGYRHSAAITVPSSDAILHSFTPSAGTLNPAFAPGTLAYTISVDFTVSSMTIMPVVNENHATLTINGQPAASGVYSQAIDLNVGNNTITVVVTAQDGTTTMTYTVTVTRQAALSSDATLSNLILSAGTLNPVFAPATTTYTANVANSVASITVTPTVSESHATTKVNDFTVTSGTPSAAISLNAGANTITILVTAQDGTTTLTYTVTVTRQQPSHDAGLNWLVLSNGTLDPSFANGTYDYTASVAVVVSSVTVTPTVNEHYATITVNGQPVTSGQPSQSISLNVGANTITIVVTAQDGTTTRTYTVTVTRQLVTVVSLIINENITVSDTTTLPVSLFINEAIAVSDAPVFTLSESTTYTLTIKINGAGNTFPPAGTYTFNKGISIPIAAVPGPGWYFLVWTGGAANPNAAGTSVIMDGNKTVTANFGAPGIQATIHSPGELRVYDSQNRVTGLVNGAVKEEIPDSSYNTSNNTIVINPATDAYYYQVTGNSTGPYGLELVYSLDGQTTTFNATGIPISSGAINRYSVNWTTLSQGQPGVTVQLDLNGDGVFEKSYTSDGTLTHDEYMSQMDTLPPVTAASLNPGPNANGWNNTNVTANLTASDTGSGVKEIHYSINSGSETIVNGASALFSIASEGNNTVTYFAKDNAGNTETPKSVTVKIDKTKPTININSPLAKEYLASESFTLNLIATDALSGVFSIQATLNGAMVTNGRVINLATWDGSYTLLVTATDKAGNTVTKQVNFTVKSARALKTSAIDKLNKARAGDKKKDENIDRAINLINDSLDSKLWVDPSHLVYGPKADWINELKDSFDRDKKTVDDEDIDDDSRIGRQSPPGAKNGITVFHLEMSAIMLLDTNRGNDKDRNEKDNKNKSQLAFEDVISDLVNADMILAKVAITDAKNKTVVNPAMNKIVSKEIESAEKEFTLAIDAANKGQSAMAVTRFSHAWLHAQLAIKFAAMEAPHLPPKIEPKDNGDRDNLDRDNGDRDNGDKDKDKKK